MKYKFHNPDGLYFVSFAVVRWVEIFTNHHYCDIVVKSLKFCQKNKGMEIVSWCIMPNHIHLIFRSSEDKLPGDLLGDFKRFTSKELVKAIKLNPKESRKKSILGIFRNEARKCHNVNNYQFWQHYNHPVELWSNGMIQQKINYVHNNPVTAGLVNKPEDYPYSSAKNYVDEDGLIDDIIVFEFLF